MFCFTKENAGIITQIDLAIDDYTGEEFSIYQVLDKVKNWHYTSIWKSKPTFQGTPSNDNVSGWDGLTIYFGKSSSDTRLVLYDKSAEQKQKYNISSKFAYWTRWEMRFGQGRSSDILKNYIMSYESDDNFYHFVSRTLLGLIQFRVYNPDNYTKTDWLIEPGYIDFVGSVESIKTEYTLDYGTSFDTILDWFIRSCFQAALKIYLVYGEKLFYEFLERNLGYAMMTISQSDLNIINSKNAVLGVADITFTDIENIRNKYEDYIRTKYDIQDINIPFNLNYKVSKYDKKREELINEKGSISI